MTPHIARRGRPFILGAPAFGAEALPAVGLESPGARRAVHGLEPEQGAPGGDRIGMTTFGSRMDVYLPRGSVEARVRPARAADRPGRTG